MSLVYKNDTYNYNGEYEMGSLNKFAQAERKWYAYYRRWSCLAWWHRRKR